jgi:hypothetical protein
MKLHFFTIEDPRSGVYLFFETCKIFACVILIKEEGKPPKWQSDQTIDRRSYNKVETKLEERKQQQYYPYPSLKQVFDLVGKING